MTNKEIMASVGVSRTTVQKVRRLARAVEQQNKPPEEMLATKPRSGAPNTVVSKRNVDIVHKRAIRNPNKSKAKDMGVLEPSMTRLIKAKGLRSMSKLVVHEIFPSQEARRLARASALLAWHEQNPTRIVIWTDEKAFTV